MNKRKLPVKILIKKPKFDGDQIKSTLIYKLKFSLQRMSLASVAVQLWMQNDIQQAIEEKLEPMEQPERWKKNALKKIERRVITRASTLLVPTSLYNMLLDPIERVGLEIFNWVEYHFRVNITYCGYQFKLRDYLYNIAWTAMGQVDYKETARSMISRCNFSGIIRFNFACLYCLEEEIKYSWKDVKYYKFRNVNSLIRFWVSTLNGNSLTKDSVEDVFDDALYYRNETAARYLWERFGKFHCTESYIDQLRQMHNANFMCFVLSEANYQEQQEIFLHSNGDILKRLHDDWLWGDHFLPTFFHAKEFMTPSNYRRLAKKIAKSLVSCKEFSKCIQYRLFFEKVWQFSPKEDMFRDFLGISSDCITVVCKLFHREYLDMLQLVLSDADSFTRKTILLSTIAIKLCKSLLINKDWDLLEVFINYVCDSEQDLDRLKDLLEVIKRTDMFSYITSDPWKQFLKLNSKSPEEIYKFKRELLYRDDTVYKLVKECFLDDFVDNHRIELYLKWFLSPEEELNEFKSRMFLNEPFCHSSWEVVFGFFGNYGTGQFDVLDMFVSWCFDYCQVGISSFKANLISMKEGTYDFNLFIKLIEQDDNLQSLKKFIIWCSINEETQSKFKSTILNARNDWEKLGVCGSLLLKREYILADEVVAWCCDFSEVEIYTLKNKYMLEVFQNEFMFESIILSGWKQGYQMLKDILMWFNASTETITNCVKHQMRQTFLRKRSFQTLDYYIRDNEKQGENGSSMLTIA